MTRSGAATASWRKDDEVLMQMADLFSEQDHVRAARLRAHEAVDPLTTEQLFRSSLYAMLSATDNYQNLFRAHRTLIHEGLDTPESVLAGPDEVRVILRRLHYGGSKLEKIMELARMWPSSDVPGRIIADLQNGHDDEFAIREQMIAELPGFGPKCSSLYLRMCGYERVVPVDLHMIRHLRENEYPVKTADFDNYNGLTEKQHRDYEVYAAREAEKHGLPPAIFQMTLWAKRANWIEPRWVPPPPRLPFE